MKYIRYLIVICLTSCSSLFSTQTTLTILTVNDVYTPNPVNGWGSFAGLATLLDQERQQSQHALTTVNGDFLSGSFISSYFRGSEMIDLFNQMQVDLVCFGNHEFDFGPEVLSERMEESQFTWLGTNIVGENGSPLGGSLLYKIYEFEGIKVGFIGLCTEETVEISNPGPNIHFKSLIPTAKTIVAQMKERGVDYIVALTHQFLFEDIELAKACPDINLILGGHEHNVIAYGQGSTLIFKSGSDAEYLCRIDLAFEKTEQEGKTQFSVVPRWKMIPNHLIEPKESIALSIEKYNEMLNAGLNKPLVYLETPLTSKNIRSGEAAIGNIFTDAMKEYAQADVALLNTGDIRGNRNYEGNQQLTIGDICKELPFGSKLAVIELTGAALWEVLEHGMSNIRTGGYPQLSGVQLVMDPGEAPGKRVQSILINGEELQLDKIYRLAATSYLWLGGDHYSALQKGILLNDLEDAPVITLLVIDYLKDQESIAPQIEGRVKSIIQL